MLLHNSLEIQSTDIFKERYSLKRLYAPLLFLGLSCLIFLPHVLQFGVFVGDSDRMNHSLTILKAYIDSFQKGQFPLWSDSIFGGYSLVSTPFQFPNPVAIFAALIGVKDIYLFAGYEALILLALSGWFAYKFLRASGRSQYSSIIGGVLYQTCNLTLLKVSQNDMSFAVVMLAPLLLLMIKKNNQKINIFNYLSLALIFVFLFNFTFLQKTAYITILGALYALWLGRISKTYSDLWIYILAILPGLIFSIPRILTVGLEFSQSNRPQAGLAGHIAYGEHLRWFEILRWFDARIFGSSWDELIRLGNGINLSEGFLLYMGFFAAMLIIYAIATRMPWNVKDNDAKFSAYIFVLCLIVSFTGLGYELVYQLFGKIGFIHYRILLIAILPACILVSLVLDNLDNVNALKANNLSRASRKLKTLRPWLLILFSFFAIVSIEIIATYGNSRVWPPITLTQNFLTLQGGALFRISSQMGLLCLMIFCWHKNIFTAAKIKLILGTCLITQSTLYAIFFIWGPDRWHDVTSFKSPSMSMAHKGEFRPPSNNLLDQMNDLLETDLYRTSFICPPKEVAINCSTRIANNFQIRTIDGYLNSVPGRLSILKLNPTENTRAITFANKIDPDLALLGLLNTKYIMYFHPGLFTNSVREPNGQYRELSIKDLRIEENPFPIAPRIFFANSIKIAKDRTSALDILKLENKIFKAGYHPDQISVVEGDLIENYYSNDGTIKAQYNTSQISVELSPSSKTRFLVLNERYTNEWKAYDQNGNSLTIYPTNLFMRGVLITPNNSKVVFKFEPLLTKDWAYILHALGLFSLLIGTAFILLISKNIIRLKSIM